SVDKVYIIGMGDDGPKGLSQTTLGIIEKTDLLFGGERHLSFFPNFNGEKITIKSNLKEIADLIKRNLGTRKSVVLASGDPNFYGIARYLISKLGKEAFEILPAISSMQLAFARVKESWDDAVLVSVHGRPIQAIIEQVRSSPKIGIFTDDEHAPGEIARILMEHGLNEYQAFVCENLGGEDERVTETSLEELPAMEFSPLNVLILKKTGENQQPGSQSEPRPAHTKYPFGIPEDEFECMKPRRGLITKTEVRVISLSKMALQKDSVVWDIGAGSGSVSIESALLAPMGRVYAIEKDEEDVAIIHRNLAKFQTLDVRVIHGRAPEALSDLEPPDAIFIGGSGGGMEKILTVCLERLKPGGRLVVNLATIENLSEAYGYFKERKINMDVSQVQVSRGSPILNLTRFEAFNPVFVIAVRKEV
ncbi:MAG: precorrin-6y C5,15-methyltransferase (decarboxylating) subunit CbiE, partial [Nitrospira sp.]|nr:precorrin-6y C5,15-methyltransferase (decarboxylating) subunit CbiE [Nitrospira sp.]